MKFIAIFVFIVFLYGVISLAFKAQKIVKGHK
jgi:cbb3-type cytochrome oxidase subunit 3